jgi:hypothetical protein
VLVFSLQTEMAEMKSSKEISALMLAFLGILADWIRSRSMLVSKKVSADIRTGLPSGILSTLNFVVLVPTSGMFARCSSCLIKMASVPAKTFGMNGSFLCVSCCLFSDFYFYLGG